jgi:NTP pyrophosphatase (non-canonical NTP hydrolase)
MIDINEYQIRARETAIYPNIDNNLNYTLIGLAGEIGELLNIYKKIVRDHNGIINEEMREKLIDEMGDIHWYMAMAECEIKIKSDEVLKINLDKLRKRRETNTIHDIGRDKK